MGSKLDKAKKLAKEKGVSVIFYYTGTWHRYPSVNIVTKDGEHYKIPLTSTYHTDMVALDRRTIEELKSIIRRFEFEE